MNNKKYIKTFINYKFFDLPASNLKSSFYAKKMTLSTAKIVSVKPFIYLCKSNSRFDKFLISNAFSSNFVFLNSETTWKINYNLLPKADYEELIKSVKTLADAMISIVIFPEKSCCPFGEFEPISMNMTKFLQQAGYNLKYINIAGAFFNFPVWAKNHRKCATKVCEQTKIAYEKIASTTLEDANFVVNHYLPSTASIYAKKFPIELKSNKLAEGFEQILYCCPHCKIFFNNYAEFNCIKCKNCGSAIEMSNNGDILLSKNYHSFDDLKDFQLLELQKQKFKNITINEYDKIFAYHIYSEKSKVSLGEFVMKIFDNGFEISHADTVKTFKFKDIENISVQANNQIIIMLKNNDRYAFQGKNKENLYIIIDLFKLFLTKKV